MSRASKTPTSRKKVSRRPPSKEVKLSGPFSSKGKTLARPTIASVSINNTRPRQNVVSLVSNKANKDGKVLLYHSIHDERSIFRGRWHKWVSLKDVYNAEKGTLSDTVEWEVRGGRGTRNAAITIHLTPAGRRIVERMMM
jgi:hypothetical protein